MIDVFIIPILEDNYAYVIKSSDNKVMVIDAGEAQAILDFLEEHSLKPDYILSTHHHWDHVNGNQELARKYSAPIIVPLNDAHKIKQYDLTLKDGDDFKLGHDIATIFETTGHTRGGICVWFKDSNIVFVGDTLFSMSCGRLFEGSAEEMFYSLKKIAALPDETLIYCGHEYTLTNAAFCKSITPDNPDLLIRIENVKALRAEGKPTIPVSLATEKNTNVFLKAKTPEEFACLRELRNNFKIN